MSFTPISLQATRANPDGSPASGTISFTLNAEMLNGTESIQPAPISGVLNPSGQLVQQNGQAIILLANDDEGTTPADPSAAYVVQENITGSSVVEYSIIILHDSTITDEAVIFTATKDTVTLSNVLASSAMVGQTLVASTNFPSGVGITAYDPTQNTLTLASNATSTVTESATISGAVDLSTLAQYEPAPTIQTYIPFTLDPLQTDGQVATWSASENKWIPTTPGGGSSSVQWVDLGLVDLVSAVMDGPTTLYNMPDGSFLSQIRFTDDPDTVIPDSLYQLQAVGNLGFVMGFGTVKSFGWYAFAFIQATADEPQAVDTLGMGAQTFGYGPFAALDTGIDDLISSVLSAASVGPIEAGIVMKDTDNKGAGVRVAAITPWAATTAYQSPASNTVATPGVLQKCAILENGTIWINDGLSGTSGGSAPDFAGNAGGSVTDGPDIIWYDTTSAPPTVGKVHVVAEIVTPVSL